MFQLASQSIPRAKIFMYGESGSGKTTFALNWAKVGGKIAVIDLEDSTKRYDHEFEFHRWTPTPTTIQEIIQAIDFLSTTEHDFTTLLIDPVTLMYDMVMAYWEEKFLETRKKDAVGHHGDHYEIQPKDWQLIKKFWRRIFYKLRTMDMNVICTARSKTLYAENTGQMMKAIGKTFDSEKGTDYEMDTCLNMVRIRETNQYMIITDKHRSFTNPMPNSIDNTGCNMQFFVKYFGDAMTRKAIPVKYITQDMKHKIEFLLDTLNVKEEKRRAALSKWGVSTIDDLTENSANEIIKSLEKKLEAVSPF